ncbi:MAG: hypothetical protein ABIH68_05655 [bacterium]
MYIEEYLKYRKEAEKERKRAVAASRVVHPIVLFFVVLAVILWLFVAVTAERPQTLSRSKPHLEMNLFDVGQGVCFFIRTPSGESILVDSGPPTPKNAGESAAYCLLPGRDIWKNVLKKYFEKKKIKSMNAFILTSPDAGFAGGAASIFNDGFPVGKVLATDTYFPGPRFKAFRNIKILATRRGIFKTISCGDTLKFGDVIIQVIAPLTDYAGFEDFHKNGSAVLRIVYKNTAVLYAGNCGLASLNHITSYKGLYSNVLVAPNYSSDSSFSVSFLEAVSPEVCLISVGRGNSESYPDSKVLAFYDKMHIKYLRTDDNGTITILSDGNVVNVKKEY